MEAQGATVRWVDHSGMNADAMMGRNENIPLLQICCGRAAYVSLKRPLWKDTECNPRQEAVRPKRE